jgi:hypothetical protein
MLVYRSVEINFTDMHIAGCELVQKFVYLGSLISCHGSSEGKIRGRRAQLTREAAIKLNRIWRSHDIRKATKIKMVQTLIHSIMLYVTGSIKRGNVVGR